MNTIHDTLDLFKIVKVALDSNSERARGAGMNFFSFKVGKKLTKVFSIIISMNFLMLNDLKTKFNDKVWINTPENEIVWLLSILSSDA